MVPKRLFPCDMYFFVVEKLLKLVFCCWFFVVGFQKKQICGSREWWEVTKKSGTRQATRNLTIADESLGWTLSLKSCHQMPTCSRDACGCGASPSATCHGLGEPMKWTIRTSLPNLFIMTSFQRKTPLIIHHVPDFLCFYSLLLVSRSVGVDCCGRHVVGER